MACRPHPSDAFGISLPLPSGEGRGPPHRGGKDESGTRHDERFGAGAARLAGIAGVAFGWSPDRFWAATPAELAALARTLAGDAPEALDAAGLARLMEMCPDG